jgi:copper(I)-binding protein
MRQFNFFSQIFVLLILLASASAFANDTLQISGVWSRATPPLVGVGAVYFTAENRGSTTDTLIGVSSPVAERAEMHTHTHTMKDGMMMMHQLDSIEVPAGGTLEFKPGGNHIMLIGLKHPLLEGERFPLTLKFKHAGNVELNVEVHGLGG